MTVGNGMDGKAGHSFGLFISFEGGEGAGKSTQLRHLESVLIKAGHEVVTTREPGGTPLAEAIRALLLTHEAASQEAMTQALLFAAARRDHVERVIRPALARGSIVLCDRFADSTRAYQGGAITPDDLETIIQLATGGLEPHLTILLDVPVAAGLTRARKRAAMADTFEQAAESFHEAVRMRFLTLARNNPARILIFDAQAEEDNLTRDILARLAAQLPGMQMDEA